MTTLSRNQSKPLRWQLVGFSVGFLVLGTLAVLMFAFTPPFGRPLELVSTSTTNDSHRASTEASQAPTNGVGVPQSDFANLVSSLAEHGRFSRNLILYDYLADASLEELVEIGGSTLDVQPSNLRHQIQTAVVRRMRLEDFESAMEILSTVSESIRGSLTTETFAEWVKINLNAATAHARELDEINRLHALRGILSGSKGLPRNQLLAIAQALGHQEEFNDHIALEIIDEGLASPASVWNEFLSEFGDSLGELSETQLHVLLEISTAWISHDQAEAIQAIKKLPGIESGRKSIASILLARIAKDDLPYALSLAAEMGIQNRSTLVEAIKTVSEQQPQSVFLAVSNYEKHGMRRVLQRFVIETWAELDPLGLIEYLESLPKFLHLWGEEKAFLGLARSDPARAAEAISTLKRQTSRKSVSLEVARYWSRIDPEGAFRWSKSDKAVSSWRVLLQETVLKVFAESDPDRALELALSQHVAEDEVGLEAAVIEGLAEVDIERAESMLEHARNHPTREASFGSIGIGLIIKGRTDQALKIVGEESVDFQAAYFDSIGIVWAYFEPSDLHTKIGSMPTDSVQKNLATRLASLNSVFGYLTSEQKEGLTPYIPDALRGMLD